MKQKGLNMRKVFMLFAFVFSVSSVNAFLNLDMDVFESQVNQNFCISSFMNRVRPAQKERREPYYSCVCQELYKELSESEVMDILLWEDPDMRGIIARPKGDVAEIYNAIISKCSELHNKDW